MIVSARGGATSDTPDQRDPGDWFHELQSDSPFGLGGAGVLYSQQLTNVSLLGGAGIGGCHVSAQTSRLGSGGLGVGWGAGRGGFIVHAWRTYVSGTRGCAKRAAVY